MKEITFLPIVKEKAEYIINILSENNFFSDNFISDTSYATYRLSLTLTDKFINGELLNENDNVVFDEDELETILTEIIVQNALDNLKNKGVIDSVINEDDEEIFFLTQQGKNIAEEMGKPQESSLNTLLNSLKDSL